MLHLRQADVLEVEQLRQADVLEVVQLRQAVVWGAPLFPALQVPGLEEVCWYLDCAEQGFQDPSRPASNIEKPAQEPSPGEEQQSRCELSILMAACAVAS